VRYLGVILFLAVVISATVKVSEQICSPESDEEFCDSVGVECGVDIKATDTCGEHRYIECRCVSGKTCVEKTLRCTNVVNRVSPLLTGDLYIVVCDHSSPPTKLRRWSLCPRDDSRTSTTQDDPINNTTNTHGNRSE
jgi:hypothetical protein